MTAEQGLRPWEALPEEAYTALVPQLPALTDEIVAAIADGVPEYAAALEGPVGPAVRRGVEAALGQFVEMARQPGAGRAAGREFYVALGRGEVREGRTLEALLAAYRIGARVAWRRLATAGLAAGLSPETLVVLAESIFAYIDELSAESAEGYAREQAERAGEVERRRRTLVELLVATPPADPAAVAAAAEAARWRLAPVVAVAAWRDGAAAPGPLPADTLAASVEGIGCAIVPDPDGPGRRSALARALDGTPAGLGPTGPWAQAGTSLRRAVAALRLAEDRGEHGLLAADEHRTALLWRADQGAVRDLAAARLAPLAAETPSSRERLEATLLAWLRNDGNVPAAAAELGVHPQTVRYRLNRLREAFRGALEEPDARFELELALRARADLPVS